MRNDPERLMDCPRLAAGRVLYATHAACNGFPVSAGAGSFRGLHRNGGNHDQEDF